MFVLFQTGILLLSLIFQNVQFILKYFNPFFEFGEVLTTVLNLVYVFVSFRFDYFITNFAGVQFLFGQLTFFGEVQNEELFDLHLFPGFPYLFHGTTGLPGHAFSYSCEFFNVFQCVRFKLLQFAAESLHLFDTLASFTFLIFYFFLLIFHHFFLPNRNFCVILYGAFFLFYVLDLFQELLFLTFVTFYFVFQRIDIVGDIFLLLFLDFIFFLFTLDFVLFSFYQVLLNFFTLLYFGQQGQSVDLILPKLSINSLPLIPQLLLTLPRHKFFFLNLLLILLDLCQSFLLLNFLHPQLFFQIHQLIILQTHIFLYLIQIILHRIYCISQYISLILQPFGVVFLLFFILIQLFTFLVLEIIADTIFLNALGSFEQVIVFLFDFYVFNCDIFIQTFYISTQLLKFRFVPLFNVGLFRFNQILVVFQEVFLVKKLFFLEFQLFLLSVFFQVCPLKVCAYFFQHTFHLFIFVLQVFELIFFQLQFVFQLILFFFYVSHVFQNVAHRFIQFIVFEFYLFVGFLVNFVQIHGFLKVDQGFVTSHFLQVEPLLHLVLLPIPFLCHLNYFQQLFLQIKLIKYHLMLLMLKLV